MPRLDWQHRKEQYVQSQDGYLGAIKLFSVYHNPLSSKDEINKIAIECYLPGFKQRLSPCETQEEAKQIAERALANWLSKAGLLALPAQE